MFTQSHTTTSYRTKSTDKVIYEFNPEQITAENEVFLSIMLTGLQSWARLIGEQPVPSLSKTKLEKLSQEQRKYTHIKFNDEYRYRVCGSGFNQWHYDIYEGTEIGKGAYGSVKKIVGTLTGNNQYNIVFKKNLAVGKIQNLIPERIWSEYQLSKRVYELQVKLPTFVLEKSVMVMKYIEGDSVAKFAENDVIARQNGSSRITSDKRLQASMIAARKLHMKHLRNILHRDVKPANAIVNFGDMVNLTILDLGLGEEIADSGNAPAGTAKYAPAEYFMKGKYSVRSDIYGLAWILIFIWGGEDNPFKTIDELMQFANNPFVKGLFLGITDIEEKHQDTLHNLINKMMLPKSELRPELPVILERLEKIHLERIVKTNPTLENELTTAYFIGVKLRNNLDQLLIENPKISVDSLDKITTLLAATFASLHLSSPIALQEFIDRAGVECWKNGSSLDDIFLMTNKAIQTYKMSLAALAKLRRQADELSDIDDQARLNSLTKQIERSLERANVYTCIDEIMLAQQKMQKYLLRCEISYSELVKGSKCVVQDYQDDVVPLSKETAYDSDDSAVIKNDDGENSGEAFNSIEELVSSEDNEASVFSTSTHGFFSSGKIDNTVPKKEDKELIRKFGALL